MRIEQSGVGDMGLGHQATSNKSTYSSRRTQRMIAGAPSGGLSPSFVSKAPASISMNVVLPQPFSPSSCGAEQEQELKAPSERRLR